MLLVAELPAEGVVSQTMQQGSPSMSRHGGIDAWVRGLQARGRYSFSREEAAEAFGRADLGLTKALGRLARNRRIVSPRRGFYVIVPAEFSIPGSPPADWFIDALMRYLQHPYYVGLLTAAAYHGAAHQQPQQFQVVAAASLRPVRVGRVNIVFVATVLSELAEKIGPDRLVSVVEETGVEASVVQRLGYLLDSVEMGEVAGPLATWIAERSPRLVSLRPGRSAKGTPAHARWRVRINADVEPDL